MKHLSKHDLTIMEEFRNLVFNKKSYDNKTHIENILQGSYYKNKENLYKLLGNCYKISKKFTYHKNYNFMAKEIHKKLNNGKSDFFKQYNDWAIDYDKSFHGDTIGNYTILMTAMGTDNLVENKLSNAIKNYLKEIVCSNGKSFKVNKDMKLMRFFSKIVQNFPKFFTKEAWEDFRIAHSMIVKDAEFVNTLTLSIHPLDFWTMSDNGSKWHSCMSWIRNGEYRMGTIEMMNSPCVLMAYLESNKPWQITPNSTWNNKIWRELYVVDDKFISSIKGYPYENLEISEAVVNWIAELAEKNLGKKYNELIKSVGYKEYHYSDNKGYHEIYFTTDKMYNDFDDEDNNHVIKFAENVKRKLNQRDIDLTEAMEKNINYDYAVEYSGEQQCMICGDKNPRALIGANILTCINCEGEVTCEHCENLTDDWIESPEGSFFCKDCYGKCQICGEEDEFHKVYLHISDVKKILNSLLKKKDNKEEVLKKIGIKKDKENYYNLKVCEKCYSKYLNFNYNNEEYLLDRYNAALKELNKLEVVL